MGESALLQKKDYHESTKDYLSLRLLSFELLLSVNGEQTTVNMFSFELSPFSFELFSLRLAP
jgi:hypothetical protein